MPHAAVAGSKIYWASSTSTGHYLFCFETQTSVPCSNPLLLNGNAHGYGQVGITIREVHRGGGTIEEDGLIYTFTDDHKVHCVIPGELMIRCGGYPKPTSLGEIGFPANLTSDQNHGSSIDRIVDDQSSRIYSTIHIDMVSGGIPPDTYGGVAYESGTYLNCFDTSEGGGACIGFVPLKLHVDANSFSGRLFFSRDGSGVPFGICSTGFSREVDYNDMSAATEISCVDLDGNDDPTMENQMAAFRNELATYNQAVYSSAENARWGTWGDPHYNSYSNRLFYPTHRVHSAVICWDFDGGSGGSACNEGLTRATSSGLGPTQDYGYFSEGNCIFGLGHAAIFWAFRADDIGEECNGSGKTTPITPCNCGGNLYWGTFSFDVSVEQFEAFTIEVVDDNGARKYPDPGLPPHDLLSMGDTIDLNSIPIEDANQRLWVTVAVVAKEGMDPWQDGESSQTFTIEIDRMPRLTD